MVECLDTWIQSEEGKDPGLSDKRVKEKKLEIKQRQKKQ